MRELPLAVVISALIKDGKILLIERNKGDYVGLLGLPGGKVEKAEHVSEAAVREIAEESGIQSEFKSHLGFVSEHLIKDQAIDSHFLLHICELEPQTTEIQEGSEGRLAWYDLDKLQDMKEQIIPSDFLIIEKLVKGREKSYFDCSIEKVGEEHILRKFE